MIGYPFFNACLANYPNLHTLLMFPEGIKWQDDQKGSDGTILKTLQDTLAKIWSIRAVCYYILYR